MITQKQQNTRYGLLAMGLLAGLMCLSLSHASHASSQDQGHHCQGGHNCNGGDDGAGQQSGNATTFNLDGAGGTAESSSVLSATTSSESVAESNASIGAQQSNQSVTIVNPDDIRIRNVVSPDTPNSYPTSPCRIGVSAGLALVGGSLSGGGSVEDKECTLRETARSFKELGVPQMGLYLLCTQSAVILGDKERHGIGADECIRRVDEFTRNDNGPAAERDHVTEVEKELEILRNALSESEYRTSVVESQLVETRQMYERAATRRLPAPKQQIVQEFLTPEKRAALEELVKED